MKILHALTIMPVVAFLIVPAELSADPNGGNSPFRFIDYQDNQWTIAYTPKGFETVMLDVDGSPHLQFLEGTSEDGGAGSPQLPVEALNLGIPEHTFLVADIIDPVYDEVQNQLIAPAGEYVYANGGERTLVYRKKPAFYQQNRFFPSQQTATAGPYHIRQQCIGTIRVRPYQYNPVTKVLRRLINATLRVRLISTDGKGIDASPMIVPGGDPHYEAEYKSLVWNYDQAGQWRQPIQKPALNRLNDPTRDWFETGRTYYRINVASDGWYKVTKADLAAAGANTSQIDVPSLRVFGKGVEVPLFIRPDTTVEFYAVHNYGDSTYVDTFTDTSAYFLTWGGSPGLRFASTPQPGGAIGANVVSTTVTRHYEQNNGYYYGVGDAEVSNNDVMPGEGWAWGNPSEWFYPTTTRDFPFSLDTIDVAGGPSARVRTRLFGTTGVNQSGPDHNARFWINDSLVGEIFFEARTEGRLDATFPTALLSSPSSFRITSVPTQTIPNQFYLDWFEIDYQRFLRTQNDQLFFVSPGPTGANPSQFTVQGFSNPQIEVFDLTAQRTITGGIVTGDVTIGYTIQFKDTSTSAKRYLVVAAGGQVPVPALSQKIFTDIRANAQGADYIIVTHKVFLAAAQRLGTHRQAVNGVRTRIVDVQDIYDEFNYGAMNGTTIKAFLHYAYLHWPAPAPAYLLLFGDASWDFHKYLSSSTQTNYVPGYGIPTGDNWFACFNPDTSFIPSMLIGRIPARDSIQAQRYVDKTIEYDNYMLGDWNKKYMFIAGLGFNSEQTINGYVTPAPLGGMPYRVYKTTPAVIDGEHKKEMRDLVRDGLVFINFLGHSGGRIWEVDIGDPNTLENANGQFPFMVSVSCNVGAFAEPSNPLLAEDFALADNRGAIASWASSTEGWASAGTSLVHFFLNSARVDSLRDLGSLTNTARVRLWQTYGNYYIYVASVKCNPLLGDPLTRLAIPRRPDLALTGGDISMNIPAPTPNDSTIVVRIGMHNYGLVPVDSVGITLNDTFNGQTTTVLNNVKVSPTRNVDSLFVRWDATEKVGRHTLTATLDPLGTIAEVNELNNIGSSDQYVYANLLSVVKPLNNMVVSPGTQTLVVTSPLGLDSVGFQYFFELDTVAVFNSPFLVQSGPVAPGPVKGEWLTPSLGGEQVYFWRARTMDGGILGNWVTSSFVTSVLLPTHPNVRVREFSKRQFERDRLIQVASTDSGATIAPNPTLRMTARSLGYRGGLSNHKYSQLFLNDQVMYGYEWVVGRSFIALKVNEFNGSYEFRSFDVQSQPALADSMKDFVRNASVGNYVAIAVIFDGRTNVTESLYVAIESLGSMQIRSVLAGQSWAFIGRKGYPAEALESLTNDSAIVSLQIPNYYSFGSGSLTTTGLTIPTQWDSFHWRHGGAQISTDLKIALLGIRSTGAADTLRIVPRDSTDINLGFLNFLTSGPTYSTFRTAALFSTANALVTPVLHDWWIDFVPPADLAVSSRTVGVQDVEVQRGTLLNLPVTVHNIGSLGVDSARIVISLFDKFNRARPIVSAMLDTIPVNGTKSTTIPIPTVNLSRRVTLQVNVTPSKKYKDLLPDNNNAYYTFNVIGATTTGIQFFADGVHLMDGDYVAAKPRLVVRLPKQEAGQGLRRTELFVDKKPVNSPASNALDGQGSTLPSGDELIFTPQLSNGYHELKVRSIDVNLLGSVDTLEQAVGVDVEDHMGILKLYNYPNPFARDTYFTFVISGAKQPEELSIRIFTVAGRRLKEIMVPQSQLAVGMNRVYWDGRDADGDELANGYYFYQVLIKGEGRTESATQKLAKIR